MKAVTVYGPRDARMEEVEKPRATGDLNVHHGQPEDGVAIHLISTVCELISSSPNELM